MQSGFAAQTCTFVQRQHTCYCCAGENYTIAPGNMGRFQLIFRLTSTKDPNYLHIHTLKGIAQAATGPWTQYMALDVNSCEELPCMIAYPVSACLRTALCIVLGCA